MKNKNICWFSRGGDLDFFAKIATKLETLNPNVKSFYVCDTKEEKKNLRSEYGIDSYVLNDFFKKYNYYDDAMNQLYEFEKKYSSIPFRRLVWGEMYEKNYDDKFLSNYLVGLFNFWENILVKNKIEYVVSELPAILPNNVLWTICKTLKIKFIGFNLLALNDKSFTITDYNGNIGLKEAFSNVRVDKLSENYTKSVDFYETFLSKPEKPKYYNRDNKTGKILKIEKGEIFQKPPSLVSLLKGLKAKFGKTKNSINNDEWYYNLSGLEVFNDWFFAKSRMIFYKRINIFCTNALEKNEKYFLYTLNMKHEWMIYSFAGVHLAYPLDTIRFIASTLPLGVKLYVKEHTAYFPQRPISFYSELKKIPNVVLVDRRENTFDLIKKSEGVVSIGGTPGWEAFLLGKPVITLNETWYSDLPGMIKIKDNFELLEYMNSYSSDSKVKKEDKIKAIYSLYELGINGVLGPRPVLLSDDNIEQFAYYIYKRTKDL